MGSKGTSGSYVDTIYSVGQMARAQTLAAPPEADEFYRRLIAVYEKLDSETAERGSGSSKYRPYTWAAAHFRNRRGEPVTYLTVWRWANGVHQIDVPNTRILEDLEREAGLRK